jgi:hypothetical protein
MHILESAAPLPSVRELKHWQSAPVQLPGQEDQIISLTPAAATTSVSGVAAVQTAIEPAEAKSKDKRKTKKPPASDMAILFAMQQMQRALPEIVGGGSERNLVVNSQEAAEADRLKSVGAVPSAAALRGATKRTAEDINKDPAKQARFVV